MSPAAMGLAAVVAAAYGLSLLLVSGPGNAVLGVAVQAIVMAPGVWAVARLAPAGRRWLPALTLGPAVGMGLSNLMLMGVWAAGGRGLWVIPVAAGLATLGLWPARRMRGRWRFHDPDATAARGWAAATTRGSRRSTSSSSRWTASSRTKG